MDKRRFFVCVPQVLDHIENDTSSIFERTSLENLAKEGQLNAYKHTGIWHAMDALRDKKQLTEMWTRRKTLWAVWQAKKE